MLSEWERRTVERAPPLPRWQQELTAYRHSHGVRRGMTAPRTDTRDPLAALIATARKDIDLLAAMTPDGRMILRPAEAKEVHKRLSVTVSAIVRNVKCVEDVRDAKVQAVCRRVLEQQERAE